MTSYSSSAHAGHIRAVTTLYWSQILKDSMNYLALKKIGARKKSELSACSVNIVLEIRNHNT